MSQQRQITFQLIPFAAANFLGFLAIGIPLPVLSLYVEKHAGVQPVCRGLHHRPAIARDPAHAPVRGPALRQQRTEEDHDARIRERLVFGNASICSRLRWPITMVRRSPCSPRAGSRSGSARACSSRPWPRGSIVRVGPQHAGRAMAWSGIAMYGAIALGAPLGLVIYHFGGFNAVVLCAVISPCLGALLAARWADAAVVAAAAGASFGRVLTKIWAPGLSMALASSGVGTISSFLSLRYQLENWMGAGLALTGFGFAYIVMRLLFGGLPDRLGGFRTGSISLFIEALGLLLIAKAPSPELALAGATLTGVGYSLVFPSLGVEALRRVPGENRGLVISAYLACFDLGVAMAGPSAGLVAHSFGSLRRSSSPRSRRCSGWASSARTSCSCRARAHSRPRPKHSPSPDSRRRAGPRRLLPTPAAGRARAVHGRSPPACVACMGRRVYMGRRVNCSSIIWRSRQPARPSGWSGARGSPASKPSERRPALIVVGRPPLRMN